jgi:hypothetical protein
MKCERQARTRSSVASPPPAAGRRRRIHVRYPYSIWKGLGRIHGTALPAQTVVAPRSCTYRPIRCRRRLTTTMASRRVAVVGNGVGGGNGNVMVERTLAGHMVTKGRAVKNGAHAERDPTVYCPSMPHTHTLHSVSWDHSTSLNFPQAVQHVHHALAMRIVPRNARVDQDSVWYSQCCAYVQIPHTLCSI